VIIVIWSLSAFPSSLSNMMFTLVMGHAVSPEHRAFLMSRRWIFLGVAKLVALPLISQLIERLPFPAGYQLAFGINTLISLLALYCGLHIQVPDQVPAQQAGRLPLVTRMRSEWQDISRERPFLIFVGGRATLNLGLALVSALVPIFWVNHLRASDAWVGYFNMALSGATLVSYFPWVRIKRKFGTRWTLVPAALGTALYPALLSLARTPTAVLPFIAFNGFAGAGINLAFFDALLENCPRDKEARFVAINMTAVNLMGVIGPPLGAALLGVLGIRWVMVTGTIVAMAGVAIFAFVRPRKRHEAR
jgi:Na+/melibiose symporter-like transporter